MVTKRVSLWYDPISSEFLALFSEPNKRIRKPKQYPFANKIGGSFLGTVNNDTLANMRKNYLVIEVKE